MDRDFESERDREERREIIGGIVQIVIAGGVAGALLALVAGLSLPWIAACALAGAVLVPAALWAITGSLI